jgi:hypothetical protein
MAERVSDHSQVVRATDEHAAGTPLTGVVGVARGRAWRHREPSPHSRKFAAVTAALAGVAIAAVAVAVGVLLTGTSTGSSAQWSTWSPSQGGLAGERQIADEVSPFYRASAALQLAVVTVQNISASGNEQVAVRNPDNGTLAGLGGTTAVFNVCGLGSNCGISTGTPSASRLLLLRREALELSLYTFKYISDVGNVVAILPPGHTSTTNPQKLTPKPPAPGTATTTTSPLDLAVVFQRASLKNFLQQPLRITLPGDLPPLPSQMQAAPEALLVSVITSQALFRQHLIQAQDGTSVLVLDPMPPQ